jgi:CheY-like chemotaxis protein
MMMPGMDGAATIQALCRLDPQVRIIATSGVAGRDVTQPGVMHFLRKPYTASTLIAALTKVLQDPIRHGHS